ncbi:hypothetical protein MS2017_0546 [Bathymodiolus thermophilus thioautotrophic gill symbiont]|uniref:Uncharacterized protein n=1 Tax=Bathymodiolus thermophilus thioautotrophic gill symbiont TaxID=2360 RepID=A0A3G3IKC2_9GAMM|nr:hypothetical protein [Bathymodiolus thermophilus thioautotrophic gill symbiont]AYQ56285.1 hypothetical protein MS2017_0546 [Bathymodiolus thermophilus thioautotrophic gill symbiont]
MSQVEYFYEGESEKKLITYLKDKGIIKQGKVRKFNLWEGDINRIIRMLSKSSELYFIIDTDTLTNKQLFKDNLKKLKGYNVCLIVQNKNLEDELSYVCEQTKDQLFTEFGACNKNEFTSKFIQANLAGKFKNCDFEKLWSRDAEFKKFLEENYINVNITWRQ